MPRRFPNNRVIKDSRCFFRGIQGTMENILTLFNKIIKKKNRFSLTFKIAVFLKSLFIALYRVLCALLFFMLGNFFLLEDTRWLCLLVNSLVNSFYRLHSFYCLKFLIKFVHDFFYFLVPQRLNAVPLNE